VLRLLRGEPLDQFSRETQDPAHQLEAWQRRFLAGGLRGLRGRREASDEIDGALSGSFTVSERYNFDRVDIVTHLQKVSHTNTTVFSTVYRGLQNS
jgi:hypothetical protein